MKEAVLIGYVVGKVYSQDILIKELGDYFNQAVDSGYFELYESNSDGKKYVFTQKGKEAAWRRE